MNLRDLLIIYLACGAPFGVYYFLQNRNLLESKFLWLKSLLRFVFWIPFALKLVARKSFFTKLYTDGFDKSFVLDAEKEFEIERIKKKFENVLVETKFELSIYEFREIFERYVGLTLEMQTDNSQAASTEKEIFRITNHTNKNLAEICLNRRNRNRLSFHQKLAKGDFFEVFDKFVNKSDEPQNLFAEAMKLLRLLNDFEAQAELEELSKETLQTQEKAIVNNLENDLWKSEKQKLLAANRITSNMQIMSVTGNLSKKD